MPHSGDQGDHTFGGGAHYDFLVEPPEVFKAAPASRHDDQIRTGDVSPCAEGVKPPNACRHFWRAFLPLNRDGPDQDLPWETIPQAVQNIPDHRPRGRRDHTYHLGQKGQLLLARGIK